MATTFITSAASLVFPPQLDESFSKYLGLAIALANIAALFAARAHVGNFWNGKAKIPLPGAGEYNEAITRTQQLRLNMAYLASTWSMCAGLLAVS